MRERRIPGALHPVDNPHIFVLTAVPGTNGRLLRVRCACMAEVKMPSRAADHHFYAYDWIAQVETLDAAVTAYQEHVANTPQRLAGEAS